MKLIEFPEQTCVIAKDQPQYMPMPAHIDPQTKVITCLWKLSWRERLDILFNGQVWQRILTFGDPVQPQKLTVDCPFINRSKQ